MPWARQRPFVGIRSKADISMPSMGAKCQDRPSQSSFNYAVGPRQNGVGNANAERRRRVQIEHRSLGFALSPLFR
jgi:hypothetical protein